MPCPSASQDHRRAGLDPPCHNDGSTGTGASTHKLRVENKRRRHALQEGQAPQEFWSRHAGQFELRGKDGHRPSHRGGMCPGGLAQRHPAADKLLEYATKGCPARTGRNWTCEEMQAAVDRSNHASAKADGAWQHLQKVALEKVTKGQACLVD